MLRLANKSPELQKVILARCASDVSYFVNEWCWTYEPRGLTKDMPFTLWPAQERVLKWFQEIESNQAEGVLEKSRDQGATWLCIGYAVWRWLFTPGWKGGFGSRLLRLVDKQGELDSIFEKIRFLIRRLPSWMLPAGFDWKTDDVFCRIRNPENGASITGEGGDQIGRGGRTSMYFIDEAAFLARPHLIDSALSQTTPCKIWVSTPCGTGNPFALKRFSGEYPVERLYWKEDPRKNRWIVKDAAGAVVAEGNGEGAPEGAVYPWFEKERAKLSYDPVTLAQEIEIDYTASLEGIVIPGRWVRAAIRAVKQAPPEKVPMGKAMAALDVADGGRSKNVLGFRRSWNVFRVNAWHGTKEGTTETALEAVRLIEEVGAEFLSYDAPGVGAGVGGALKVRRSRLTFAYQGVNTGEPPTERVWPDGRTSQELFTNLKAELWWIVRRRFEKTYERIEQGIEHPWEECISIPDCPELIQQLSNVTFSHNENGKIAIEKKSDLAKRGVASPDFADMLMLLFAPVKRRQSRSSAAGGTRTRIAVGGAVG